MNKVILAVLSFRISLFVHAQDKPCIGSRPGREWVKPEYDLSKKEQTRQN